MTLPPLLTWLRPVWGALRSRVCFGVFSLGFALLTSGCATYTVRIETLRERGAPALQTTYFLDLTHATDLARAPQFQPALRALRAALRQRGFVETTRREDADTLVEFGFGARMATVSVSHGTRSTEVRSGEQPLLNNGRPVGPLPITRDVLLVQEREVHYECWLHVAGSDAKTGHALWQVEASAEIGAADRNAILPCLIAAAKPWLDPRSNAVAQIDMGQASAEVRALRDG